MFLLDIIFPKYCVVCARIGSYICQTHQKEIERFGSREQICLVCEKPSLNGETHLKCKTALRPDGFFSFCRYSTPIVEALGQAKYRPNLAFDILNFLVEILTVSTKPGFRGEAPAQSLALKERALLTPIPLYQEKLKIQNRGFNQSKVIAKKLAQVWGLPKESVVDLLIKTRETRPQVGLKEGERKKNIRGAFALNETICEAAASRNITFKNKEAPLERGKTDMERNKTDRQRLVVLVDDVATTGSTLLEGAKVLKQAKFEKVWCLTLART